MFYIHPTFILLIITAFAEPFGWPMVGILKNFINLAATNLLTYGMRFTESTWLTLMIKYLYTRKYFHLWHEL